MTAGRTPVALTADGRTVLLAAGLAAIVNLVGLVIVGVLIGVAGATGSLGLLRVAIMILSGAPAAFGAYVGAARAVSVLGRGLPAAAVGIAGSLAVVIVLAVVGNVGEGRAAVGPTIVAPLLLGLLGAWLGGIKPPATSSRARGTS